MTPPGEHAYLVSNFREALSILENLRVSPVPGRGMRHLRRRPVVDALRAAEVEAVTGGLAGEFPVLCRVDRSVVAAGEPFQPKCVPLSQVMAFVFRSEADRDLCTGKLLENLSMEGRRTEVDPALFGHAGPPRFQAEPHGGKGAPDPGWTRADALAGAAGAVLALCRKRPGIASRARAFLVGDPGLPVSLRSLADGLDAPDGPWAEGGVAASAVALALRSARGQEPLDTLETVVSALGRAGYPVDRLAKFRTFVTDILMGRRSRSPQELADAGDILLRALLLLIQRDRVDEILDDTADGIPPGPSVHLAAMALGGLREGLARMPSSLKSSFADPLGEFATAIEDDPALSPALLAERLAGLLPQEVPPAAPGPEPAPPGPSRSPPALPPEADLVHLLETSASELGLVDTRVDEGVVGTCPSTQVVARIVAMSVGIAGPPGPVLVVSVGGVEESALLRKALRGAARAWQGSFLCLPEWAERVELAFPVGLADRDDLPRVLACNVQAVRQWRSAAAEAAEGQGRKHAKGRRGATKGTRKSGGRAPAPGADQQEASGGGTSGPAPPEEPATGAARPEASIADAPAAPGRKRPPARRSARRKAAPAPAQDDLLETAPQAPGPPADQVDPSAAAKSGDGPAPAETARDREPSGGGR